jgi:hypothetical protein
MCILEMENTGSKHEIIVKVFLICRKHSRKLIHRHYSSFDTIWKTCRRLALFLTFPFSLADMEDQHDTFKMFALRHNLCREMGKRERRRSSAAPTGHCIMVLTFPSTPADSVQVLHSRSTGQDHERRGHCFEQHSLTLYVVPHMWLLDMCGHVSCFYRLFKSSQAKLTKHDVSVTLFLEGEKQCTHNCCIGVVFGINSIGEKISDSIEFNEQILKQEQELIDFWICGFGEKRCS